MPSYAIANYSESEESDSSDIDDEKIMFCPDEVTAAPLETRHRKRGRPKKAGPALNME